MMDVQTLDSLGGLSGRLRVVYMRSNVAADEALAVGVVYTCNSEIRLLTIEGMPDSALYCLYDGAVVSNLRFSVHVLRQLLRGFDGCIEDIESPASNIFFGIPKSFVADDLEKYVKDYLKLASSLVPEKQGKKKAGGISQKDIGRVLYHEASQIDVIAATTLFEGYRYPLARGKYIRFPIYGESVVGAPVSFVTRQVGAAKNTAEAYSAKLSAVSANASRKGALYVLLPSLDYGANHNLIEDSVGELELVASANDVTVRFEKDSRELAKRLILDDEVRGGY